MLTKKVMYSAAAVTAFGLLAGNAFAAHVIESATDDVKVQIYGQVNRAIMFVDDGAETNTHHVDNDHSSTRLGVKGKVSPNEDLTTGLVLEAELRNNPSNEVDQLGEDVSTATGFEKRKMEAFLKSKRFGTLTIGQGSESTDGIAEIDLSNTSVVGYSDVRKLGGDLIFTNEADDSLSTKLDSQGKVVPNLVVDTFAFTTDGDRIDRIRYDSPEFAGFSLSASSGESSQEAFALNFSRKFDAFKLAAGVGYETTNKVNESKTGGSASILLNNGLNFTVAAGEVDKDTTGRDNPGFWYGKIGYIAKVFESGPTSVSFDYGNFEDGGANGDELDAMGVQLVQDLTKWGTQLYAGYRNYDAERTGANLNDINVLMTGVRVKF